MMRAILTPSSAIGRRVATSQLSRFIQPGTLSLASSTLPRDAHLRLNESSNNLNNHHTRSLSTNTETADDKKLTYKEKKAAAKQRRREVYQERLAAAEKRKHRRDNSVKHEKRNLFRKWFIKKKVDEEYMNRKSRQAGLDWKIQVTVILQRYFILLPDQEPWEKDWFELKQKIRPYQVPWGNWHPDLQPEEGVAVGDDPSRVKDVLTRFPPKYVHPPSRITEADETGNTRTIDRKLAENLFLVVKEEAGQDQWRFPTVPFVEEKDETLLLAARKCILDRMGESEMEFWCPSSGPVAVDMVALPEEERAKTGFYGTKNFFYKFVHYHGDLLADTMPSPALQDYAWLEKNEFLSQIKKEDEKDRELESTFYKYVL